MPRSDLERTSDILPLDMCMICDIDQGLGFDPPPIPKRIFQWQQTYPSSNIGVVRGLRGRRHWGSSTPPRERPTSSCLRR